MTCYAAYAAPLFSSISGAITAIITSLLSKNDLLESIKAGGYFGAFSFGFGIVPGIIIFFQDNLYDSQITFLSMDTLKCAVMGAIVNDFIEEGAEYAVSSEDMLYKR